MITTLSPFTTRIKCEIPNVVWLEQKVCKKKNKATEAHYWQRLKSDYELVLYILFWGIYLTSSGGIVCPCKQHISGILRMVLGKDKSFRTVSVLIVHSQQGWQLSQEGKNWLFGRRHLKYYNGLWLSKGQEYENRIYTVLKLHGRVWLWEKSLKEHSEGGQ